MKHIIFGGFDYAVRYEMDQDAIFRGIDYFVDNDPDLIGTTYLGKEIKSPDALLKENKEDILILIGSIVYRTELAYQLKDMCFKEDKDFIWAIDFCGDEKCSRLWKHIEWNNKTENAVNLESIEFGEYFLSRLKIASKMIDFKQFDTIIDLGAANERVRNFIPNTLHYIPYDYIRYSNETVLCDFNKHELPLKADDPKKTCILSMASIQCCQDWKWFLRNVAENCSCCILGHQDFARTSREYRRTSYTAYNSLFGHDIISYMFKLGFILTDAVDFRLKATIYKFVKK